MNLVIEWIAAAEITIVLIYFLYSGFSLRIFLKRIYDQPGISEFRVVERKIWDKEIYPFSLLTILLFAGIILIIGLLDNLDKYRHWKILCIANFIGISLFIIYFRPYDIVVITHKNIFSYNPLRIVQKVNLENILSCDPISGKNEISRIDEMSYKTESIVRVKTINGKSYYFSVDDVDKFTNTLSERLKI